MIQAIIKKGKVIGEEIPSPVVRDGHLLIRVVNSCISAGTEVGGLKQSGENIVKRAMKQPENVQKVLDSVKAEGVVKALNKTKRKLNDGSPTGYSISGVVTRVGKGCKHYQVGDRVAAAGAGLANHAEYVNVPEKLCATVPISLSFEKASTITLGAIALHGVRRADLKLGERAVVFGTGILGLLSVQFFVASGVRVAAVDLDDSRLALAKEFGAELLINPSKENIIDEVNNWTESKGADAVLFSAATANSEPLADSFKVCKRKGKVVLLGVVGMQINRADIYPKEIDFQISTSYGPGRYDEEYEQKGHDYPFAYVRWTENRNMQEYLRLLSVNAVNIDKIIHSKYSINEVTEAFESFDAPGDKPLIVLLSYSEENKNAGKVLPSERKVKTGNAIIEGKINMAMVGAGGFGTGVHLPNFKRLNKKYNIYAIADIDGVTAKNTANAFGASYSTTNVDDILKDDKVNLVVITTNHKTHGELVLKSLKAGKNVMIEKPLTIDHKDIEKIKEFYESDAGNKPIIFVGYNRRFSKYAKEIKKYIKLRRSPLFVNYRMNAGYIPNEHWVHSEGGRIVGEACHIIDLMTFFTESKVVSVSIESLNPLTEKFTGDDNKSIVLKYSDGSVCNIQYFSVGNKSFSKEYMDLHFDNKTIVLDDYKQLKGFGVNTKKYSDSRSDKGHFDELNHLYESLIDNEKIWPIELWDLLQTSEITLSIADNN
jgi:predicted dehydrogenase/threonine dehydrogenase-like Zn-dependent dehydrogenase